ncbi:MAG: N-acetylmuramoyl-L-alanine amidase [Defluviitoga tunisiensis]|jgi:N-acetylmuramoyl-L-alanine amidase|uniref:N-acetylmuramoyl-L-alanine amidase n=1 Tax=Defluviitoga tunisiensis TaxID=1006576 RepID=A0A0C7NVT9_DEFTU|nr:N-acetylmuramoyl-L-alanine amidase [Defluviitoga tunisiensis]MDD3600495.1 N-acetylmuramoyl-L-alanine amidase [Defluviitoga tunisiensis]MDY0379136.1 N-acetylmuramoyl-L-alanine amidase [Defluviitoga tunisiensis]CEP77603.1 N-acetylmuramoyl-L-alanine amidase [Defluviitoga tunisiensis]HHV00627.1 N-acetylmuramoyl-L-alanine amidase [Defluviitoga tunisiensis]HOB55292.1 N-acetylmuramoyl-L-alanine amidase [Defluviitoga tunisiensis]
MSSLNNNFKEFFIIGLFLLCFLSIFSKNVYFQWRELDVTSYFEENENTYIDLEVIAKLTNRSIDVFNSSLIYIKGEKWNVFIFPQNNLAIINSSESLNFYPNDLKEKNGKIYLTPELLAKVMDLELISNDSSVYLNVPLAQVKSIKTIIQKTDARIIIDLSSSPEDIGIYPLVNKSGYLLKIKGAEVPNSYIYEEYKNKINFIKAYHYSPTEVWVQIKLNNTANLNEIIEETRIVLDLSFEEEISLPVLVLDPGHGGIDSGAVGPTKVFEKDLTLAVAKKVQELLSTYNINVYLTRTTDIYVDLHDRAVFSNEKVADLFISLHMNDYPSDKTVSGSEVYYFDFSESAYARRIAYRENLDMTADKNIIQTWVSDKGNSLKQSESFAKILGSYINGNGIRFRGIYKAEFAVLAYTRGPAVLFEMEFISNPDVEKKFSSGHYVDTFAEIIKNAVVEYFNLK